MDLKLNKVRVVKPAPPKKLWRPFRLKKSVYLTLLALIVIIVAGIVVQHVVAKRKDTHLNHSVALLTTGWHDCSQGLKQLGSVVNPSFANNTKYNRSTRERVLAYVAPCEFTQGHHAQAVAYAQQLQALYKQDGSAGVQKYAQWQTAIQYMKASS